MDARVADLLSDPGFPPTDGVDDIVMIHIERRDQRVRIAFGLRPAPTPDFVAMQSTHSGRSRISSGT